MYHYVFYRRDSTRVYLIFRRDITHVSFIYHWNINRVPEISSRHYSLTANLTILIIFSNAFSCGGSVRVEFYNRFVVNFARHPPLSHNSMIYIIYIQKRKRHFLRSGNMFKFHSIIKSEIPFSTIVF